jgi:hypothetical protein
MDIAAVIRREFLRFISAFEKRFSVSNVLEKVNALTAARKGSAPVASGVAFEKKVAHIVSGLSYMETPLLVDKTAKTGHLPDIRFSLGERTVGMEVKRRNAFEGGGPIWRAHPQVQTAI